MCMIFCCCTKFEESTISPEERNISPLRTRSSSEFTILPNPYNIEVMNSLYASRSIDTILTPTDLYVRFLPQDSTDLNQLRDLDLTLFPYPLDLSPDQIGDYLDYVAYLAESGEISDWLYTTVKPDFDFPMDVPYEILQECYIPEDSETITLTETRADGTTSQNLEEAAFEFLGYTIAQDSVETRLSQTPCGRITVEDNTTGLADRDRTKGVCGVKVICTTFVKIGTTYTNQYGGYLLNKKFIVNPVYIIMFQNSKGFDIWDNLGPISKAIYWMGTQSKKGYNKLITPNNPIAWRCSAVNNAGYDYYTMCENNNITLPPRALKVWILPALGVNSAPMLRHIWNTMAYYHGEDWILNMQIYLSIGLFVNALAHCLQYLLPDIFIGHDHESKYGYIYDTVNHEMAHASHFSQVGGVYWARYISYIVTSWINGEDMYGTGHAPDYQVCGIGEMWGYFMGFHQFAKKYGLLFDRGHYHNNFFNEIPGDWIHPQILWPLCSDFYEDRIFTLKEMSDFLTRDVDTYDKLILKMCNAKPDKAETILNIFSTYGINYSETYQLDFNNMVVDTAKYVIADNITVNNCTVIMGNKLTLTARSSITINAPFTVEQGAELEISIRTN